MRALKFILKAIFYFVIYFILTGVFVEIIAQLTINKLPTSNDFLIAQKIDNEISLTSLNKYSTENVWFEKSEGIDFSEFGGIYIKVLEKKDNIEKLEVSYITDDYEKIYTYKINNGKIIMESSYYRGIGLMVISMLLSILTLLIVYLLLTKFKKRIDIQ